MAITFVPMVSAANPTLFPSEGTIVPQYPFDYDLRYSQLNTYGDDSVLDGVLHMVERRVFVKTKASVVKKHEEDLMLERSEVRVALSNLFLELDCFLLFSQNR
jgi:hypothetical protein